MAWSCHFLEYQGTYEALLGTDPDGINIVGHGMEQWDMMVNTTRRSGEQRGSGVVGASISLDYFNIKSTSITGQTEGDNIRLYKWIDHSELIKIGTFEYEKKIAGQSTVRFTMFTRNSRIIPPGGMGPILATSDDFWPVVGQRLKVMSFDSDMFYGTITNIDIRLPDLSLDIVELEIQVSTYMQIAMRRTVKIEYDIGTISRVIVADMINRYLSPEGIYLGYNMEIGASLDDDWMDDCITVGEVLDRCASMSGYQWFIDDMAGLWFVDDIPIVATGYDLDDTGTLIKCRNFKFSSTLDAYANKMFFTGGPDGGGNPVIINSSNLTEMNAKQDVEGGTGVYGNVIRDASIDESSYNEAESHVNPEYTTNSSQIRFEGHGQYTGYIIWNITRGEYATVDSLFNENLFYITPLITGQVPGDYIVFFSTANLILKNALKKQSTIPNKISFETDHLGYSPGEKMKVHLDILNIGTSYWLVDSVKIYDPMNNDKELLCKLTLYLRNGDDFSTQRPISYKDYFMTY